MNKNNKIIIAAIAVVALLLVIGALFASGILSGNDDDKNTASYEVSFIDGDDVIKTLNIKENSLVSRISSPEKEGYIFTGWYSDKELTNEFDFENTLITKNTNIYAKWVKASEPEPGDITFTVTFNTDGASSIASQTVKEGEKAVRPADPLKSGYKFEGWYSDSSFTTKFDFKTPITFDITLYAKFTASQGGGGGGGSITPPPVNPDKTYPIIYNGNGNDSGIVPDTQILSKNNPRVQIGNQNSLSRAGYTFVCWNTESDGTGTNYVAESSISFNDLNSDLTLYAKWIIGTYTPDKDGSVIVIINPGQINDLISAADDEIIEVADTSNYKDANTVSITSNLLSDIQKENGNKKDISVKTAKGSVQLSSEVVDSIIRTGTNDNISIKIGSEPDSETKYNIEITAGIGKITQFPETITISIPYTLRDGENPQDISVYYIYDNKEYLVHGTYNKETKCVDIKTNHLSTYEIRNDAKYSINFILNGGKFDGTFKPSDYMGKEFNSPIETISPSKAGYTFNGWFTDKSLKTAWDFDTDTVKTLNESDPYTINLYAKWEADPYNITYNLGEGTNSSGNPASYTIESETISFENPTKTGYTFKGWFTDKEFKNQITSIVKGSSKPISLYASWEKNKYSVTLSSGTGYSLTPLQNNIFVEHDGSFQFKLSINDDFKQSSPVVISNGKTIPAVDEIYTISNISENQVVTVKGIETNTYIITFANKDGFYTVNNDSPVSSGKNFTFAITLNGAYNQSILTESSVKVFGKYGSVSKTGENVNQYTITNVTSDLVVLVDGLKKNEYVVTFFSDNDLILKQKVSHGDSAALISNLTKSGYKFVGWYLDAAGSIEYSNEAITEDTTLYAKWNAGTTSYFVYVYQEKISYTSDANKYELIHADQKSDSVGKTVSVNWENYPIETILGSVDGFEPNESISKTSGVISAEDSLILKLYFDRKEFTMTFNAPEGSQFESISKIIAKYGQPVSPIRVTLPGGYTLDYWYESDDDKTPYLFTTMPDRDVALHSKYTAIYYLEYNANGGAGDLPYTIGYANGTDVILFGPNYPTSGSYILTKEGYTFGGWEYGEKTYQPGVETFTMPSSDVTLKAVWIPITYNVHFDGNGSTSGSMTDQIFTYDAAQNLTANAFVKTGYTFIGWSETSNGSVKYADQASVSNLTLENNAEVTLYAVWNINKYTITFNSNGGSSAESITDDYNASVTLPTPTKEGHAFDGWYSDESLNAEYISDKMPAENITLYAKWSVNTYNVTFHYNNGSEDTISSVNFNSSITQPNVSKLGYTLDGWYSDSNFNTRWNFASDKMPSHDMNLYVKWTATSYTVNFYNGTELITSTTYTVESDSIQMPLNLTKTGYTFNGWFDSTLTNEFSYTKGITVGDLNLYAKFTINKYTITFNSNGGSSAESITDDYNASVTLPTPTKEGHAFDGWYSDESLNAEYISDKMPAENITLYAKWTKNSYTLTINYIYENGSKAHDPHVSLVEYGETYTVISPSVETLLPDTPTVTGTMPADDLTVVVTYGDYIIRIDGNNYRTIEDSLASAQEGDRLILLRDYTIQKDLTIPKGILLVLPCSDDDAGYDLTAEYEKEHNPDGTTEGPEKCDYLYRTLTVSSNATLTVDGQLLVNAVTGRASGGYRVMDITGGYSQIILEGNIIVKNEGIMEVCGYITGSGQITAESGAEVREMYIVQHWRGGSQALAIYPDLFPFNEYDCHSIQSNLVIKSGASLFGNVKMYETWYNNYHYTRFPQIDAENGMIRLLDGAYLTISHDSDEINGTNSSDKGRTHIDIYGGATFSHSTLEIVGLDLSTKDFIYPIDGDISFGLHTGDYTLENNFKLLTGGQIILYEDASLSLNEGNTLVLYDEFNDVDNTSTTEYPDRPASLLILHDGSIFNINGTFAGIISFADSGIATVIDENAEALVIDTKEVNGYVGNDSPNEVSAHGYVTLHFETKYQYTVTFKTNGGSEVIPLKYFLGDYLEDLPEPIKTGFNFEGWYLDSKLTQKYNDQDLTGNTTLYAKWEDSKYIVSFETNKGSSAAAQEISHNHAVTKPADPTRSGYIFEGWYSDAALTSEYDFNTLVTENITLYANWDPIEYTISFVTNNGETLDSIKYTADDASSNIQKLSKTGYTFEKWCIDKELTTGFEFKQYETSGDLTLYAEWVPVVYTIKYYDKTQLNLEPSSYTIEDSITLPTATKSGYEFAGWHESSDLSGNAVFSINEGTTGNKEYYASWNETVYSITYMDGENKIENLSPASYTTTKRTELPTPSKEGYTFNGWYSDAGFTDKALSIPIGSTGDKTFYASFTINQYKITFNSNEGSAVDSITADYNATVSKPADPTKTGYTFAGWFKDENLTNAWNFETDTVPVDGTTLYAKWALDKYAITLHNGDLISSVDYNVTMDSVELSTPSKAGYAFNGWFEKDAIDPFKYIKGTTVGNIDLYASFTINQYTITFNSNGGSEVDPIKQDYGTTVSKPTDPTKKGYIFAGWFKDNETFLQEWNFEIDTMPVDGTTLFAKWTPITYSVIFNENSGTGSMEGQAFTYDETKKLNANSYENKGYTFLGWSLDKDATEVKYADSQEVSNLTYENNAEVTLYAVWQINQYTIIFNSNEGSAVDSITADYNATVSKPTDPTKEGHTFAGWYSNEELTAEYTFTAMPADNITLYAKWDINQYTITFNSNGGSAVDPITKNYATVISKPADPTKEGYIFAGWFKDNETFLQEWNFETDTVPVDGTTLYAKWTADSYNVKYYVGSEIILNENVTYGTSVPKPNDPTKTGYTFIGWDKEIPSTMPANNLEFRAVFEINNHTITYMIDGITVETQTYAYGATISPYQPEKQEGKTFSDWSPDLPDTMPDYNMTVSGSFNVNTFTITYYVDGIQYGTPQSVKFGDAVTPLETPTKEGYSFSGWDWNGDVEGLGAAPEKMPAKHLSVDGYFTINSYNVTFHYNNGSEDTTTSAKFNTSITEPTNVSKLGSTLEGWYSDSNFSTKWNFALDKMPAYDVDMYAKWTATSYTVNFYNGTESISSTTYTVDSGAIQMPSNPSKTGYTFNGWFEKDAIDPFKYIKGTTVGNIDLYASFTINQYTITFNSNGGSAVGSITQNYAAVISKPTDPTKAGYTFVDWYTDDITFNNEYSFTTMPAENITLYAKWNLDSYSIKYYDGSSEIINLTPTSYNIDSGEITLQDATKNGYTFAGWYDNKDLSGNAVLSIPPQSTGDKVFYAKWTPITYTVIFNANSGEGSIENQSFRYDETKNLTANTFTKTGYEFLGWSLYQNATEAEYTDGQEISNLTPENNAEVTLYAVWNINQYTITFNSNGGSEVESITADYNTAVSKPNNLTKEGYAFGGWYKDDVTFNNEYTFTTMPAENITLYAKWTVNSYNVTFHYNNGSEDTTDSVQFNSSITEPTNVSKLGSTLEGWYSDSNFSTKWNFASDKIPSHNLNLYARWSLDKYSITFNLNGGSGPINDMEYTIEDGSIILETPTRDGYLFEGWYENDTKFEYVPGQTVRDHTLVAKWVAKDYAIKYMDRSSEITVKPEWPTKYTFENATTLPISATKNGYTFAGWYDNKDLSGNAVLSIPPQSTGDKVFYAKWTPITYTVIFNANGGTGSTIAQDFTYDAAQNLIANTFTRTGYNFLGWSADPNATEATYADESSQFNLADTQGASVNLYAVWKINQYTITFNSNGGSEVESISIEYNATITKPADPSKTGYKFEKWYSDKELTSAYVFGSAVTENLNLYANWTPIRYQITFNSNGGEGSDVRMTFTYDGSQPLPLNAFTKEGHRFIGWSENSSATEPTYLDGETVNITSVDRARIILYAIWSSGPYVVSLPTNAIDGHTYTVKVAEGYDESSAEYLKPFEFAITFDNGLLDTLVPIVNCDGKYIIGTTSDGLTYNFIIDCIEGNIISSVLDVINLDEKLNTIIGNILSDNYSVEKTGKTITVSIKNANSNSAELLSALSILGDLEHNSVRTNDSTLLSYLSSDENLWEDNNAQYAINTNGYTIIFKQDTTELEKSKLEYLTKIAQATRVFRGNNDWYPVVNGDISRTEVISTSAGIEYINGMEFKFIDLSILYTQLNGSDITIFDALTTNFATVMALIGHEDLRYGTYSEDTTFGTNMVEFSDKLFDNNGNINGNYISYIYKQALTFLKDMGIPISDIRDPLSKCFDESGIGYDGFARQYCVDSDTGLRYTDIYHFNFSNGFESVQSLHTITHDLNLSIENFGIGNTMIDSTLVLYKNQYGSSMLGVPNSLENVYKDENHRFISGELIIINGPYTKSDLTVTSTNGSVMWINDTSFIMPDGDIAITIN